MSVAAVLVGLPYAVVGVWMALAGLWPASPPRDVYEHRRRRRDRRRQRLEQDLPVAVVTVLAVAFGGRWALLVADHEGVVIPMGVEGVGQLVLVTDSRRDRDRVRRLTRRKDVR